MGNPGNVVKRGGLPPAVPQQPANSAAKDTSQQQPSSANTTKSRLSFWDTSKLKTISIDPNSANAEPRSEVISLEAFAGTLVRIGLLEKAKDIKGSYQAYINTEGKIDKRFPQLIDLIINLKEKSPNIRLKGFFQEYLNKPLAELKNYEEIEKAFIDLLSSRFLEETSRIDNNRRNFFLLKESIKDSFELDFIAIYNLYTRQIFNQQEPSAKSIIDKILDHNQDDYLPEELSDKEKEELLSFLINNVYDYTDIRMTNKTPEQIQQIFKDLKTQLDPILRYKISPTEKDRFFDTQKIPRVSLFSTIINKHKQEQSLTERIRNKLRNYEEEYTEALLSFRGTDEARENYISEQNKQRYQFEHKLTTTPANYENYSRLIKKILDDCHSKIREGDPLVDSKYEDFKRRAGRSLTALIRLFQLGIDDGNIRNVYEMIRETYDFKKSPLEKAYARIALIIISNKKQHLQETVQEFLIRLADQYRSGNDPKTIFAEYLKLAPSAIQTPSN